MGTPRVVAIVQARMASTRLPGKVLADLDGAPMLARVIQRLQKCESVDRIVVATTRDEADDPICDVATQNVVSWHRQDGDSNDVLGRYVTAARCHGAEVVIRVTADCPLIDPGVVSRTVTALLEHRYVDYASNVLERTYPDGLDVEVFWLDTLLRLDRHCVLPEDREHVTRYLLRSHRQWFTTHSITGPYLHGEWRWTVDTASDLEYVRQLYRTFDLARMTVPYYVLANRIKSGGAPVRLDSDEPERTAA